MEESKAKKKKGPSLVKRLQGLKDVEAMGMLTSAVFSLKNNLPKWKANPKEIKKAVAEISEAEGFIVKYINQSYYLPAKRSAQNSLKSVWDSYQEHLKVYKKEVPDEIKTR